MDLWSICRGSICHGYMCILLYMKCIGCNGFAWIYGQLAGGPSAMGTCAFCYILNLLGVMVLQGSMVNWGSICQGYMWILLYVKLLGCNSFAYMHAWLEEGWAQSAMGICAFCYMWNLFSLMVLQRHMLDWRRGFMVLHRCLINWRGCMLLYMKLIWCSGFPEIYAQLEEGVG